MRGLHAIDVPAQDQNSLHDGVSLTVVTPLVPEIPLTMRSGPHFRAPCHVTELPPSVSHVPCAFPVDSEPRPLSRNPAG
jgi:hypothetical protein